MSISDRSRKAMENLGLTGYEIRVYLSLLETGSMTARYFKKIRSSIFEDLRSPQQPGREGMAGVRKLEAAKVFPQITLHSSWNHENTS